jgi:hypothetical protein
MPSSNILRIHELLFICSRTFREIAIRASLDIFELTEQRLSI